MVAAISYGNPSYLHLSNVFLELFFQFGFVNPRKVISRKFLEFWS